MTLTAAPPPAEGNGARLRARAGGERRRRRRRHVLPAAPQRGPARPGPAGAAPVASSPCAHRCARQGTFPPSPPSPGMSGKGDLLHGTGASANHRPAPRGRSRRRRPPAELLVVGLYGKTQRAQSPEKYGLGGREKGSCNGFLSASLLLVKSHYTVWPIIFYCCYIDIA